MPNYSYYDPESKDTYTLTMTISEMLEYEKENPNLERIYEKLNLVDPVRIGVTRPPSDFQKYVLGKVKANQPLGSVEKRWTIKKEI